MSASRLQLGDSHNFGRRVALSGKRVAKPRTVLWEWLTLAAESPLRRFLDEQAEADGLGAAFAFLPTLKFYASRSGLGGEVERVALEPLRARSSASKRELASIIGRSLALWSWLGVSDLHWENLVLGVDAGGATVFGPLDVEMIWADLSLPTETKLLPDADPEYAVTCQHACGVRRALPYLGKPIDVADLLAMAGAYRGTLAFLDRHATKIFRIVSRVPGFRQAPIRVCLRGTEEYVRVGAEPLWPPLLHAETEQLERGDIPYFFRLYGKKGLHYFKNRALTQLGRLPLTGDVPQLDPLLELSRGVSSPSRAKLRKEGLLTLLSAFDHPEFSGKHRNQELSVTFGARSLAVKLLLEDGEELRSPRDLSDFVSSVYLPCRCGEVRSVFVPAATKCRSAARGV
jgi:hypothetical protein